jgi:putative SOS response-associated peptidase YedK
MRLIELLESWKAPDKIVIEIFAILTTAANELVAPLHDCMPVILHPDTFNLWLSIIMHNPDQLHQLYRAPVPTGSMVILIGEAVGERRRMVDVKGRLEQDGKVIAEAEVIMYRTAA